MSNNAAFISGCQATRYALGLGLTRSAGLRIWGRIWCWSLTNTYCIYRIWVSSKYGNAYLPSAN